MNYRTTPEAVALAKARPLYQQETDTHQGHRQWALAMLDHVGEFENVDEAAIRILSAEFDALETERDQAQNAADHAKAFKRVLKESNAKLKTRCDALAKERDAFLEALRAISVADWKTAGELRGMARIAAKGAQQ